MSEEDKVNWVSVINFLEKQYSNISLREKQWQYEKEVLNQKINGLEAELRSNVIVCEDLVNRIKILQIALKEEKMKRGSSKKTVDEEQLSKLIQKFNLTKQIQKSTHTHEQFLNDLIKDLRIVRNQPPRIREREEEPLTTALGKTSNDRQFQQFKRVGAHLDVITTAVAFQVSHVPFFATSSEDCLIKIWNSSKFIKEDAPEPVHTLRKHTGPLFSLTSCQNPHNSSEVYLFSGGIEGDIKSWKMTPGQAHWTKCWLNGTEEEQTIWQLQASGDKLLSSSSDGYVRLLKISGAEQLELTYLKQYKEKQFNQTAIKWVAEDLFMSSSSSAPRIILWNLQGGIHRKFLYEVEKGKEGGASQANKLEFIKEQKLIVGGCEDGFVRLFDLNSGKIIKKLQAKGSVGSLLGWEWNLIAGDHSGCMNIWQTRTFRLIEQKQNVHLQKYDNGLTCLARSGEHLVTAGADGIVKLFI